MPSRMQRSRSRSRSSSVTGGRLRAEGARAADPDHVDLAPERLLHLLLRHRLEVLTRPTRRRRRLRARDKLVSLLAMPADELAAAMAALPLPIAFVRFIAVCEVLGALGLVLPGVVRIRTDLTPLAAAGLVVIMVGAVTTTVATMDASMAILPLVVGILAATVAYGRTRVAPLTNRRAALQPAT